MIAEEWPIKTEDDKPPPNIFKRLEETPIPPNPLIVLDDNEVVVSFRVPITAFFEWAARYLTEPN